jgi:hypothetical protein
MAGALCENVQFLDQTDTQPKNCFKLRKQQNSLCCRKSTTRNHIASNYILASVCAEMDLLFCSIDDDDVSLSGASIFPKLNRRVSRTFLRCHVIVTNQFGCLSKRSPFKRRKRFPIRIQLPASSSSSPQHFLIGNEIYISSLSLRFILAPVSDHFMRTMRSWSY